MGCFVISQSHIYTRKKIIYGQERKDERLAQIKRPFIWGIISINANSAAIIANHPMQKSAKRKIEQSSNIVIKSVNNNRYARQG